MEYEYRTETTTSGAVSTDLIDRYCEAGWEMMYIDRPRPSVVIYHFRREIK